jgi:hypothetical protein
MPAAIGPTSTGKFTRPKRRVGLVCENGTPFKQGASDKASRQRRAIEAKP